MLTTNHSEKERAGDLIYCFSKRITFPWQEKSEEGTHTNVCAATPIGTTDHSSEPLCPSFAAKLLKGQHKLTTLKKKDDPSVLLLECLLFSFLGR